MNRPNRIWALDVLRLLATLLVFIFYALPLYHYESNIFVAGSPNFNAAMSAVGMFFLLSGACLMLGKEENFNTGDFYLKKLAKLLLPYYILTLLLQLGRLVWEPLTTIGIKPFSFAPLDVLLFLTGQSEYWSNYGIGSWFPIVGEWFLSVLILCYLLFPLLRKCLLRNPHITLICALLVYILVMILQGPLNLPEYFCAKLIGKLVEFILGMYLMLNRKYLKAKIVFPIGMVIAFLVVLFPVRIPLNDDIKTNMFIVPLFISCLSLPDRPLRFKPAEKILTVFSTYSYEIYLLHHVVLYIVALYTWMVTTRIAVAMELILAATLILIGAVVLKEIERALLIAKLSGGRADIKVWQGGQRE